jgi:hypothetical protein
VNAEEAGQVTGTKDKDYNIIWFVEQCLSNALRARNLHPGRRARRRLRTRRFLPPCAGGESQGRGAGQAVAS